MDTSSISATITHRIRPEDEAVYEAISKEFSDRVRSFPGFLRREVIKLHSGKYLEYIFVLHFDSEEHLRHWERSEERQDVYNRVCHLLVYHTPLQPVTGLETWFTIPSTGPIVPPPRRKMAVITWLAIFPLITGMTWLAGPYLRELPLTLQTFVTTVALVPLMTWVVMPRMTRLFHRWLFPESDTKTAINAEDRDKEDAAVQSTDQQSSVIVNKNS